MADDTTFDPSTWNATTANNQLALQQALAMSMINQQPQQGQVVPGGPNSFYVPTNKFSALSSALQKVMGAYTLGQTQKTAASNQNKTNQAILSAYNDMNTPNTSVTTTPAGPAPDSTPTGPTPNDPDDQLEPIQTNVNKMNLTQTPKSTSDNMSDILKLANLGPIGQMMAQANLTPHKYESAAPGSVLYDPLNPNSKVSVGGSDPKMIEQARADAAQTDPNNPLAVKAFYSKYAGTGIIPQDVKNFGDLSSMINGFRTTPVQASETAKNWSSIPLTQAQTLDALASVPLKQAQTANTQAETNFTNGARTANTNADTGLKNATTTSTQVKTGIDALDQLSTAQQDVVAKQNDLDRTSRAMVLANQVGGSKPAATLGDLQNMIGKNSNFAEFKALTSVDGLQSIKNAMQSRMGQQEFTRLFPSQVSPSMPTSAVIKLLDLNRQMQLGDLGVSRNKVMNLTNIGGQAGISPGTGVSGGGTGFQLPQAGSP